VAHVADTRQITEDMDAEATPTPTMAASCDLLDDLSTESAIRFATRRCYSERLRFRSVVSLPIAACILGAVGDLGAVPDEKANAVSCDRLWLSLVESKSDACAPSYLVRLIKLVSHQGSDVDKSRLFCLLRGMAGGLTSDRDY